MARVPTYDTPQVEQRALPGARESSIASPSLLGASADQQIEMGQGLMRAGTGVANAAAVMQERENADMIFRAETALKDDYLKYEQGLRERRGQQAWGATRDTEAWFEEQAKKHKEGLGNDAQRYLFGKSFTRLRQSATASAAQWESEQRRVSLAESANASIVGSINLAAANAVDWYSRPAAPVQPEGGKPTTTVGPDGVPEVSVPAVEVEARRDPILGIKRDIINRVQVLSNLNGWSPERKEFEEAKHLTNLHKQVLQRLADRDPSTAREYFEANKAEINGSEYDNIDKVLKISETRGTAQAWVDRLDPAQEERFALEAARIEFADKPEVRDAVVAEVKMRFNEKRQLREAAQKDAADQAWSIYSQTGSTKTIPASLIASMDGRDAETLRQHAENKAAGVSVKTNPETYYDLRTLASQDPESFRRVDLRKFINVLSPSDFQEMVKLQTGKPDEQQDAATLTQQLSNTHDLMKWGGNDKAKKGAFDKYVTDAINAEQRQRGKKLNYEERQAIIDKALIQGEVDGSGWLSDSMRYYEATPEQRANFTPDINKDERKQVIDRFKALKGYAPSEQEIIDTYKKWKGL